MKKGIDVSVYQGNIDWSHVTADFAILRAGYGNSEDMAFQRNYEGCESNDIPKGCYWFSYAVTTDEALSEANTLLNIIRGKRFEYPIFMDVESRSQFRLGKNGLSRVIRTFLDVLEREHFYPGLYMSADYLNTVVEEDILNSYPIWSADYSSVNSFRGTSGIWQYGIAGSSQFNTTGTRSVPGVDTECDLDLCYVDYPAKVKSLGVNGFSKSPEMRLSVTELAYQVLRGDWGNGADRKKRLTEAGYSYSRVQSRVDELLTDEVAVQVMQGRWGNGEERRKRLTEAGYNYNAVQSAVNKMLA